MHLDFDIDAEAGEYMLLTQTVDEEVCNPLKAWHDLGEPKMPSESEIELIRGCARPLCTTKRIASEGTLALGFDIKKNGLVYFEAKLAPMKGDRGYDYARVTMGENKWEEEHQ